VRTALVAAGKLVDLLRVVVAGVARPLRVALEQDGEGSVAVQLQQAVLRERREPARVLAEEVGFDDDRGAGGERGPGQREDQRVGRSAEAAGRRDVLCSERVVQGLLDRVLCDQRQLQTA